MFGMYGMMGQGYGMQGMQGMQGYGMQGMQGYGMQGMHGGFGGYQPNYGYRGMRNMGYEFLGRGEALYNTSTMPNLGIGERGYGYGNTRVSTDVYASRNPYYGSYNSYDQHSSTPIYEYDKQKAVDYHFQVGQKYHNVDKQTTTKSRYIDPVILDLDGNGKLDVTGRDNSSVNANHKESTSKRTYLTGRRGDYTRHKETTTTKEWDTYKDWNKKINYDVDGDGKTDRTEWLKKGTKDGFLVMDVDGDGKITGNELMNESTIKGKTNQFKTGFEKASFYGDADKDGNISGDELNKFSVWVDKNGDGITDTGELSSMKDMGIVGIDTKEGSFTRAKQVGQLDSHRQFNSYRVA